MGESLEYLYGAIGGAGVLCAYYGIGRVRRPGKDDGKALGLWLVGGGAVMVAASVALMTWAR